MGFSRLACLTLVLVGLAYLHSAPAKAWGAEGHRIIALIAEARLTPAARSRLQSLLAADPDALTEPDVASRAVWADVWRNSHRNTGPWHYADLEIDGSNTLDEACSRGDCVVARLEAFEAVLANPAAGRDSRLVALKFVLHLAGDLHQPLHLADNHDRGGNCVRLASGEPLHRYWDDDVIEGLGSSPKEAAARLTADITPARVRAWEKGTIRDWALETHWVARRVVYAPPPAPRCQSGSPLNLSPDYGARARAAAREQLERAGVRLGLLLNRALASGGGA
jgi:hypothetical protein